MTGGIPSRQASYMADSVMEAIKRGDEFISTEGRPLTHMILAYPYRDYFIKRVKGPFKKAIHLYALKYPDPAKHPTTGKWTAPFIRALDKLVSYAKYNYDLFPDIRRITIGEIEHDNMYRDPILMMLESLIEEVLDGNLEGREADTPNERYWSEPKPYGGKYTVIHRIRQHRKEICDLIGRKYIE